MQDHRDLARQGNARFEPRRSIDELQADLDSWITQYKATSGSLVLRENPDADLPGCNADDKGENDRSLITSDTKTRPLN
jgi:hypothetical protein